MKEALEDTADIDLTNVRAERLALGKQCPLLPFGKDSSEAAAHQYKIIRTKITQDQFRRRFIVISSPGPGDGKSVSAINVAAALALSPESQVLLVDADFARSALSRVLGVSRTPGLGEVLAQECSLEESLVRLEPYSNLYMLPAGKRRPDSAELLASPRWKATGPMLRQRFAFVIVDSPPVGAVADYDLLEAEADGVVLIVRPDHSNRSACFHTLKTVPKDKLLGVIINCAERWFLSRESGHDYSYYYTRTTE